MMVEWKGERAAVPEMRKHMGWYLRGLPGAARVRAEINGMGTMAEMLARLEQIAETTGA
jgi:tRNA-dihydrouridine synthase